MITEAMHDEENETPEQEGQEPAEQQQQEQQQGTEEPQQEGQQGNGDPAAQKVILAAMQAIYGDQAFAHIMRLLASGNPLRALIGTALVVVRGVYEKAKGSIPPKALIDGAQAVVLLLAELAMAAKIPLDAKALQLAQQAVAQLLMQGMRGQQPMAPQGSAPQQGAQPAAQQAPQPQQQAGQQQPGMISGAMGA